MPLEGQDPRLQAAKGSELRLGDLSLRSGVCPHSFQEGLCLPSPPTSTAPCPGRGGPSEEPRGLTVTCLELGAETLIP